MPELSRFYGIVVLMYFGVMGALELPGLRLASWSYDCDVLIWVLASGRKIVTLQGSRRHGADRAWDDASTHDGFVAGVTVVNPQSLASWAEDSTLRIWDMETLRERHVIELESPPDDLAGLDAETVGAWWQEDSVVGLWSVSTGLKIGQMPSAEFAFAYPAHSGWIADRGTLARRSCVRMTLRSA